MIEKLIDAHCLVGRDYWLSRNKRELCYENNLQDYYHVMKNVAREFRVVTMPFPSCKDQTYVEENRDILRIHEIFPWTIPVVAFNYQSPENVKMVFDVLERGKAVGVVLWPILCDMDLRQTEEDENFNRLIEEYDIYVTVHVGAGNEADIKRVKQINNYGPMDAIHLAKKFPNVNFNLSHALRISDLALKEAATMGNIMIDISGISTHLRWYEYDTNVFPAKDAYELKDKPSHVVISELMQSPGISDRLVFGTQYPFGKWYGYGLKEEIDLISRANLTQKQRQKLYFENFEQFLR